MGASWSGDGDGEPAKPAPAPVRGYGTSGAAKDAGGDADVEQPRTLPAPEHGLRLVVMRHGKSSWKVPDDVDDEMRPLKKRGRREARIAGEELQRRGWRPQVVICSGAVRARQTWDEMKRAFGPIQPLVFYEVVLHAGSMERARSAILKRVGPGHSTALLVGHNPSVEKLVEHLCGSRVEMKTAQAACFVYDPDEGLPDGGGGWAGALARGGSWNLVDFIRPRQPKSDEEDEETEERKAKAKRKAGLRRTASSASSSDDSEGT